METIQTQYEIRNAIWVLFSPAINAFTKLLSEPMYLQEVEDFSEEVFHFDECWYKFQLNLQELAATHGLKAVISDESIEIVGEGCVSVTFTIHTYEPDPDSLDIDFSELDGMGKEDAIAYLEELPSSIEPFQYVTLELDNSRKEGIYNNNVMVITEYPDDDMLNNLLDCFAKESDVIDEVKKKLKRQETQLAERQLNKEVGTAMIVEGLKTLGWSGQFVVEAGYSGFVLMIRLESNQAARTGGTPKEIVKDLPNFLAFCKDYPHVGNPQAYFVRTRNVNLTEWNTIS